VKPKFCTLLAFSSLCMSACAPVGPGGQVSGGGIPQGPGVPSNPPSRVGTLEVSGPQVFVNGTGAQSGEAIYNGNRVTTGAGSSGLINLDTGGSLQLDENTDPLFRFQLLKEGWCLVVNIASGQIFDDTHSGSCVEINTPDGSGVVASSVNVHLGSSGSTWTVLQGAVRITRPAGIVVRPLESIMVSKGRMVSTRRLSSDEAARLTEWRFKYHFGRGPVAYPPRHTVPPIKTVPVPPPSYTSPPHTPPVSSVPPPAATAPPPRTSGTSTGIIGRMRTLPTSPPTPSAPVIR
jgi:hypothetical protein